MYSENEGQLQKNNGGRAGLLACDAHALILSARERRGCWKKVPKIRGGRLRKKRRERVRIGDAENQLNFRAAHHGKCGGRGESEEIINFE